MVGNDLAIAIGHSEWPVPMDMAIANGHLEWPVPIEMAIASGRFESQRLKAKNIF